MAKSKKPKKEPQVDINDLVELAKKVGLPKDAFDGDLRDAADDEAELIYENVKSESLCKQFEFLSFHGFELGRLKQLIEEYSTTGGNPLERN